MSLDRLRDLLRASRRVVAFTGAGISTESGIPDFRSPGGIWSRFRPVEFDEFLASEAGRRAFWQRKFATQGAIDSAEPNAGHRALAMLAARGRLAALITQNVDGLHQRSGLDAALIVELHGNTTYAVCLDCGLRCELAPIQQAFERDGSLPLCAACNGLVKTATISFGQAMPRDAMRRAEQATLACDLFVAIGSSLQVYPAAGFPELAKRSGARLAIVNREATPLDPLADLVVRGEIGQVLSKALRGWN